MDLVSYTLSKSYVDNKLSSYAIPYTVKESVASVADLPVDGNIAGDLRETLDSEERYYWDGANWQHYVW